MAIKATAPIYSKHGYSEPLRQLSQVRRHLSRTTIEVKNLAFPNARSFSTSSRSTHSYSSLPFSSMALPSSVFRRYFSIGNGIKPSIGSPITGQVRYETTNSRAFPAMKKLPIGIQSIDKILNEGYVYADKTDYVRQLLEEGAPHYFMSRPRRFGKSLFLDTLRAIFSGEKDLFEGCQIHESDYPWKEHPVLMFDFSRIENKDPIEFENALKRRLQALAEKSGISINVPTIQEGLESLVIGLSNKERVVVLVDEYDQPIINNLKRLEVAEANREIMKSFYGTLKSLDRNLEFTFVTGISKFSQVSLFSGPNNIIDITMDPKYAGMMGYTEEEIKIGFSKYIKAIEKQRSSGDKNVTEAQVLEEIREWYNGYRFSEEALAVYNPFSTLNFLRSKKPASYWYSSGTPSFLIDEVKKHPQVVTSLSGAEASKTQLSDISKLDRISLPALMFQTGYLTIQGHNPEEDSYRLDFPNKEVRLAFFDSLIQEFAEIDPLAVSRTAAAVRKDLEEFDIDDFVTKMNIHFAKVPYLLFPKAKANQAKEGFYQAILFTFLEKSGISTRPEDPTNIGRIDLVSEMPKTIYIFELKLDKTADEAFDQAETKRYKEKYAQRGKEIAVVGINFSSESRNISDWNGSLFSSEGELIRELDTSIVKEQKKFDK